jgi:hypothetical protein
VQIAEAERSTENVTGTPEKEQNGADADEEMMDADGNTNNRNSKSGEKRKQSRKSAPVSSPRTKGGKPSRKKKSAVTLDEGAFQSRS